ncbi:MAG: acetylxylan esterase [Clostridia bacterium]|nr:acetylxylan esterase [Clostridia bacterium]
MKNISKILSIILILTLCLSVFASCKPDKGNTGDGGNEQGGSNTDGGNDNGNTDGGNTDGGNTDGGNTDGGNEEVKYFDGRQSVLLIGQSNMAGRGFAEDVEPISDDRILMINQSNEWVKMEEPIHFDKSAAGVGLAASFAKAFVDTFDCEIGLIPGAFGGTSISDWAVGGIYYERALEMAKAAQKDSEICAILWHQGESNRNNHSTYAEKLQVILDSFIADLGLDADKVIIITGELREISTNVSQRDTFHAQLNKLSDVYKNYGVADAEGLTLNKDIIHFDAPSLRVFGYRYFNIFKTLVTGTGYDFVDDRNHYYVGEENDPDTKNSGFVDLPSDNPGSDIGGDEVPADRIEIEGTVEADTYINSSSKENSGNDKDYIGANKNASRPIIKFNFSNILSDPGFEANKNIGKIEITFEFVEGASSITGETTASVYGFLPGAGVTDADFSKLNWNNCKRDAEYAKLYRGDATFIYKDKPLGEVDVRKTDTHITFILDYADVKQFICMEEGDNYGIAVMGLDFNASGIKYASIENTSHDIPKLDFVYGGEGGGIANVFDAVMDDPDTELCFAGYPNKDTLTYAVGEEMVFDIFLMANGEIVSAPYFYYMIEGEDGQKMTEGYVDGSKGYLTVKGSMSKPGTLRVTVYVCDENKEIQTKSNSSLKVVNSNGAKETLCFRGGAMAGFEDIKSYGDAPADLETYWNGIVADCYEGDIKLLRFEELDVADYNTAKVDTHKLYLVEIECEGGFVTGYLSVPVEGEKIRLKASFVSYGNTKKPKPAFTSDAAVFAICAHSYHLDDPNAKAPEDYGFDITENQNRDTVYFKNMFIRNITAARFLKAYIGDNSFGKIVFNGETVAPLGRWAKGDNFTVDGGSQAGFQAIAITALDKDVTRASVALTWFCDIGGEKLGRFDGWNPEYTDALMYYDCCSLATLIGKNVEVSISAAGLGDTTSEPSGIAALYNALDCTVSLTMYQNRSHTYNPPVSESYKISK